MIAGLAHQGVNVAAQAACHRPACALAGVAPSTRSGWRTGSAASAGFWAQCSLRAQRSITSRRQVCLRVVASDRTVDSEAGTEIEEEAMDKMEKSFEAVKRSFSTVRTGRANPAMLDRVEVDYYGTMSPLRNIAGISAPDAQQLVIQPFDITAMQSIEKAIQKSDLGLTPNNDGKLIRLNIPSLTKDRRKEMTKTVSKLSEDGKVAMRNVRRDAMKQVTKLKKDGDISEDGASNLETSIQELTDDFVKQVEGLATAKNEELTNI